MSIATSHFLRSAARWSLLFCLVGAPALACSGSDDAETEGEGGGEVSKNISAEDGGSIEDASGKATLDIPAGSLSADTELTVITMESDGETESSIFDFGPDGTEFDPAATLSISFSKEVPEGKKAVLATYVDGAWEEIPGSSLKDGKVSGSVDHFSKFSVIFVNGSLVAVSECVEIYDAFEACGGDLTGEYTFGDFCFDTATLGQAPEGFEECDGAASAFEVTADRALTVTASDMEFSAGSMTVDVNLTLPLSCLGGATCDDLSADGELSCTTEGEACECGQSSVEEEVAETKPYTTDGNTLTIENEDGSTDTGEYCVKGDIVEVKIFGTDGDPDIVYTMIKQ